MLETRTYRTAEHPVTGSVTGAAMLAALREAEGITMPEGVRWDGSPAQAARADFAADLDVPPELKAKERQLEALVRTGQLSEAAARDELKTLIEQQQSDTIAAASEQATQRQEMARRQRHLYATDAVYRAGIDGLRKEAEPRLAALDKEQERLHALGEQYGVTIPDDGHMAELRKAYEEAQRSGDDKTARALETEMHALARQQAKAAADLFRKAGHADAAKEADGMAGAQQDAFDASLAGYDKAAQLLLEAEQRQVAQGKLTAEALEKHKEAMAKEREGLVKDRNAERAQQQTDKYEKRAEAFTGTPERPSSRTTPDDPPAVKFAVAEASHADDKAPTVAVLRVPVKSLHGL